jgi:hypothetical protein
VWRHGAWADAPYIGVMAAVGHKEDGLRSALVEHGRDDSEVGQVGAARLRVIRQNNVAAFQVRAQGAHLVPHRVLKTKKLFLQTICFRYKLQRFLYLYRYFYVHLSFAQMMLKLLILLQRFGETNKKCEKICEKCHRRIV